MLKYKWSLAEGDWRFDHKIQNLKRNNPWFLAWSIWTWILIFKRTRAQLYLLFSQMPFSRSLIVILKTLRQIFVVNIEAFFWKLILCFETLSPLQKYNYIFSTLKFFWQTSSETYETGISFLIRFIYGSINLMSPASLIIIYKYTNLPKSPKRPGQKPWHFIFPVWNIVPLIPTAAKLSFLRHQQEQGISSICQCTCSDFILCCRCSHQLRQYIIILPKETNWESAIKRHRISFCFPRGKSLGILSSGIH